MQPLSEDFNVLRFRRVAQEALVPAAVYIRDAILGEVDLSDYLIKGDKTAVTLVDKHSQDISRPIIQGAFPQYRLNQEEADAETGNAASSIVLYHDPLDGTGGFLMGAPTPTVILGAYDTEKKEILACATIEPITGRFWFSSRGNGAFLQRFDYDAQSFDSADGRRLKVNNHPLKGGHVLVDVDYGFQRKRDKPAGILTQMLSPEGRREISRGIEAAEAKPASFYTNGGHYAYVALGRPTTVGCITTAIGGPFDIAGMLHVIEAGGVAATYTKYGDKADPPRLHCSGQDIQRADYAIATNKPETLETLAGLLVNAGAVGHL